MIGLALLAWIAAGIIAAAVAAAFYITVSANARAGLEDAVVSVPRISDGADAFLRAFTGAVAQHAHAGNQVTLYQNGDEIFPAMLAAIAAARSSIHFASFIYWAGDIPNAFADAFAAAGRRGVAVRLVLDSSGSSRISPALVTRMADAGCDVQWFRRVRWFDWQNYDHRSHRRLLIVDGIDGFTGGVGIADEWSGNGDGPGHWRDTHARVRGPAVADLQAAFVDSWNNCSRELPLDACFFPALPRAGDSTVCVVQSDPAGGTSAAQRAMAALIAGAGRTLRITNAYFLPTEPFRRALVAACARGVRVQVLMPGPFIDMPAVRRASRAHWRELLAGGVELYEFQPAMVHAKTLVIDGCVTMVGSINFDPRSFALNAECAIVTLDSGLGAEAERVFAADLTHARRVTMADVEQRGPAERAFDHLCYWVRAQL